MRIAVPAACTSARVGDFAPPDHADLQPLVSVGHGDERHQRVVREVHVRGLGPRLAQHLAQRERNLLELHPPINAGRKCGEDEVDWASLGRAGDSGSSVISPENRLTAGGR
jgi:hypothetical protein